MSAYHLALNPIKQSKKTDKQTKKDPLLAFEKFGNLNKFLFATILVLALSFSFHKSLEILQVPLMLFGMIALFIIGIFFFMSDKSTPNQELRVNIVTFLVSCYLIMTYAFLTLFLFLYAYFSINLFYSAVGSAVLVGVLFILVEHVLLLLKSSIIYSKKRASLGKIFSKYFRVNVIISLIITLTLSDLPIIYSMFLEQSIEKMIMWTYPFFIFISFTSRNALRENLEFNLKIGLLKRTTIEEELEKLPGTKSNGK